MDLSPESFERLMNWLHPNREEAGQEYQRIRALLIKNFQRQGCSAPEKLADATIDRAAQTLTNEKIMNWSGEKERYFYRVGYYILLEEKDKSLEVQIPDDFDISCPDDEEDLEPKLRCLEKCMEELSTDKRGLIDKYYRGNKAIKIKNREELARAQKLDLPGLRVRAHRIRRELRTCIEGCLEEAAQSKHSLRM
jgi:hypothetical protein